jgi:phosphoglucosamine mutase
MNRELFGTDGIRGPAYEWPLNKSGAEQIGRAIGTQFAQEGEHVVLGYDTRESSPMLAKALTEGLNASGVHVDDLGVVPTPGLAYTTAKTEARAGVMITASHNPAPDNGIKVFGPEGRKLSDATEAELNDRIMSTIPDRNIRGDHHKAWRRVNDYRRFLANTIEGNLKGMTIALDTANGAASGIAGQLFGYLGANVGTFFDKPDGRNINDGCGATDTEALQDAVYTGHYDMGFAFDGDADRLIAVDEKGRKLNGDHILYILAKTLDYDAVVATQMTNMGMEQALRQEGRILHRTDVGDRYVLEGMAETGARLGGEQSGHIIIADKLWTGDGMLAAVQLARAVRDSPMSLAEWYDQVPMLPQSIVNIDTPHKHRVGEAHIVDYVTAQNKALASAGRLNVRASGTQNQVRVMVESADARERAESIAATIGQLLPKNI